MRGKTYKVVSGCGRAAADKIIANFIECERLAAATDLETGEPFYRDPVSGKGFSYAYDDAGNVHLWWFFGMPSAPLDTAGAGGFVSGQAAVYARAAETLAAKLSSGGVVPQQPASPTMQAQMPPMPLNSYSVRQQQPAMLPMTSYPPVQYPPMPEPRRVPRAMLMDPSRDGFALGAIVMSCISLASCLFLSLTAGTVLGVLSCIMSANAMRGTRRVLPILAVAIAFLTFTVAVMRLLGVFR